MAERLFPFRSVGLRQISVQYGQVEQRKFNMILATVLRNYKCYKGINVISFSHDVTNSLNMIIGNNGVGKSAILESLDTLFKNAHWIINNVARKRDDSAVGALFLLKKSVANRKLDSRDIELISGASDFFWHIDFDSNQTYKNYEPLREVRNAVLEQEEDYYLLLIGKTTKDKLLSFLTFTNAIRNSFESKPTAQTIDKTLDKILGQHSYIYIPVETPVSSFVRLQNRSMQTLMDRDIKNAIAAALNDKRIKRTGGRHAKDISVLQIINEQLETYVASVEADIQKADNNYSFKPAYRQSTKLTPAHVTDTIIEAYYSKRVFRKDGKIIDNLSSGEKRVILLDIISAFLLKNKPDRELIVAIDEPESSLHISHCYNQFAKINKIAIEYNHQLFITTHWYGSLPCLDKGGLIHIDDNGTSSSFELSNYFEDRGQLPEDIQLKGFFDLASSLLYTFRNSDKTMVLVEGSEDKKYIEYYLNDVDLNVIPLGGCANVKKVYEYLFGPLSNKELFCKDGTERKNRIICLVDTDVLCTSMDVKSDSKSQLLFFRRLIQEEGQLSRLIRNEEPKNFPTEVEDVLEPKLFYDSLNALISSEGDEVQKEVWSAYNYNEHAQTSRIKGDDCIIIANQLNRNIAQDKSIIMGFIDSHKNIIANKYTSCPRTGVVPEWLKLLKNLTYKE